MNKPRNHLTPLYSILLICSLLAACSILSPTEETVLEVTKTSSVKISPTRTKSIPKPTLTPPPAAQTSIAQPTIDEAIAGLQGLPVDQFFDESFTQLLLRNPELLTELNLSEQFGLRNDQLNDLSDVYVRETQHLESAILDLLRSYDREALTPEQQLSYDIYEWTLDDLVRGHEFMFYDYPLNYFINSYDFNLNTLLTELHQLNDRQDVEDYISRLSQVDNQVDQLLEGLALREEAGIIPPDFVISMTLGNLSNNLGMRSGNPETIDPQQLPVFSVFNESLENISELSTEEKTAFRDAALQEIETSYIPAFVKLLDYLDYLQPIATDHAGVWKFPNGEDFYTFMLRKETSTELTPDEIHEIGLAEVARIKGEMRELFTELGYPQEESFGSSLRRAIAEGGAYDTSTQAGKENYVAAVEAIIQEADQLMDEVFDIGPSWGVEVVPGPMGGYYVAGAPDGSRPGAYHVGVMGSRRDKFLEPTIAYHEAVPGHHYQIATAQALDLPMFRRGGGVNGFVEGWALYAERLAWEMGLYEDDPYGNLGRLQMELLRAVRLVTDTGIHAKGWTRQEARSYMDEAMGAPGYFSHEVDRYIVMPAQATSYKIGMLKILELRQRAMDQLGDQFDIKEFHNLVIGNGSLPLDILERLVDEYIQTNLNQ
jgi:uncharacterized protein (DUF885 family)